jgi:hypothetical protein
MANLYSLSTSMNKSSVSLKTSKTAFLGQGICVHLCLCSTRRYLKWIKKNMTEFQIQCIFKLGWAYIKRLNGISIHKEVRVGIPLNGLTQPLFCSCFKPGSGFSTSYVMVLFVFNDLRWDFIVRFVEPSLFKFS